MTEVGFDYKPGDGSEHDLWTHHRDCIDQIVNYVDDGTIDGLPGSILPIDKANYDACFFENDPELYEVVFSEGTYKKLGKKNCDVISYSNSSSSLKSSREFMKSYLTNPDYPNFPLMISSTGNNALACPTMEQWEYVLKYERADYEFFKNLFGWTEDRNDWYKFIDCNAAYMIMDPDNLGHKKDYILVAGVEGTAPHGNRPGIMKDRCICTYYAWMCLGGSKTDGTSFSTPYVAKIATEIKRRAPHYTNDEIAQLIFSTADDLGEPGCDEIYGWGRMNPGKIFEELTRRGF